MSYYAVPPRCGGRPPARSASPASAGGGHASRFSRSSRGGGSARSRAPLAGTPGPVRRGAGPGRAERRQATAVAAAKPSKIRKCAALALQQSTSHDAHGRSCARWPLPRTAHGPPRRSIRHLKQIVTCPAAQYYCRAVPAPCVLELTLLAELDVTDTFATTPSWLPSRPPRSDGMEIISSSARLPSSLTLTFITI